MCSQDNASDLEEDDERFDPFRRTDRFGDIGTGPLPATEWALVYIRLAILGPIRFVSSVLCTLLMRLACLISQKLPAARPYVLAPAAMAIARAMLFAMGFVHLQHTDWRRLVKHSRASSASNAEATRKPQTDTRARDETPIVVCNHVSWLDILLVQYFYAGAFVARIEQRKVPIIGGICDALPCVYVDREKVASSAPASSDAQPAAPSTTDKVVQRINAKHADPQAPYRPLCIFAEGTTTNGNYLLPFRTGAFVAGKPVQPLLISYGRHHRGPSLSWETIEFPSHLKLVLSTLLNRARVVELPVYTPNAQERADAGLFARNVRAYMSEWANKAGLHMTMSDSTFQDKKALHNILRKKHGIALKR